MIKIGISGSYMTGKHSVLSLTVKFDYSLGILKQNFKTLRLPNYLYPRIFDRMKSYSESYTFDKSPLNSIKPRSPASLERKIEYRPLIDLK